MKRSFRIMAVATALLGSAAAATTSPAQAQRIHDGPRYYGWQASWDTYKYDHLHVILGTVSAFAPYRVTVLRHNGGLQTVDLKNGTEIVPTGATPRPGEHVALVGAYSQGTFIASRVILRG